MSRDKIKVERKDIGNNDGLNSMKIFYVPRDADEYIRIQQFQRETSLYWGAFIGGSIIIAVMIFTFGCILEEREKRAWEERWKK